MSAGVDMLPRQWDKEPKSHFGGSNGATVSSIPVWKKNLMMKKVNHHQQNKNTLLFDEVNDISDSSAFKSVLQRGTMVSYFYPAEDNVKSKASTFKEGAPKLNSISQECGRVDGEEESILPVHQNPILLHDLERRSKDLGNRPCGKSPHWRSSSEEQAIFPADVGEDSVFDDSLKSGEDGDSEEVVYGRGFVHKLLLKFTSLAHQDEQQQKHLHLHRTSPKVWSGGMYDSEPSLSSKEGQRVRSKSPEKIGKQDNEEKSFSDGEDKIEPVLNTLCMFEKLFCSRKKSQEDRTGDKDHKENVVSPTAPSRKITQKSVPVDSNFVSKSKINFPDGDRDPKSHSVYSISNSHLVITRTVKEEDAKTRDGLEKKGMSDNVKLDSKEVDTLSSPVDVKLVKSMFEAAADLPKVGRPAPSKEIKKGSNKSSNKEPISSQSIPAISSDSTSATVVVTTNATSSVDASRTSTTASGVGSVRKSDDRQQLRQHKRHSSKDYLEIKQSEKISNDYKVAMESSQHGNKIQTTGNATHSGAKLVASVARPGKLLVRSSGASASVDVLALPKYNDIRTGEFVPASKAYLDEYADDYDNGNFDFEFEGAGVRLDRSLLSRTRDAKKVSMSSWLIC